MFTKKLNLFQQWLVQCGDCLDLLKTIPDASIDLCLTDLPYGTTRCKWDVVIPFAPMWEQLNRITKRCAPTILFSCQPFTSTLVMSNPRAFRYDLIWEKTSATGHLNSKRMPLRAHEVICVFYRSLPTYNPIKSTGHKRKVSAKQHDAYTTEVYGAQKGASRYDSTERFPRSVLTFSSDKQKLTLHPTQKPVELMRYLIRTYTNPGELVLDFTCGSGTTGVAALLENRKFIGIEKEPAYVATAIDRISAVA